MASSANRRPIFTHEGFTQMNLVPLTANTTADLSTNANQVALSAATVGTYLKLVRFRVITTTNTATHVRVWHATNTAALGTTTNNACVGEQVIPASTVAAGAIQPPYDVWLDYNLPPDHALYVTAGATHTGAIGAIAIGGKL